MTVKTRTPLERLRTLEFRPDSSYKEWDQAARGGAGGSAQGGWGGTITHSVTAPQAAYYGANAAMTMGR